MDFHKDEFSMSDTVQRKSTSHSDSPVFWINGKNVSIAYTNLTVAKGHIGVHKNQEPSFN